MGEDQGILFCRKVEDVALAGRSLLGKYVEDRGPLRIILEYLPPRICLNSLAVAGIHPSTQTQIPRYPEAARHPSAYR